MNERQIAVWDLTEKKLLRTLTKPGGPGENVDAGNSDERLLGPTFESPCRQLVFSPDGRCLAAVVPVTPGEVIIALWKEDGPLAGQAVAMIRHISLPSVAFSPDSCFLGFSQDEKKATVWNIAENRAEHEIELPMVTVDGAVGFDPRGERLEVHCHDVEAKPLQSRLLLRYIAQGTEAARLDTGGMISTTPISFSPDGRRVAVSGSNRTIAVLDVAMTGQPAAPVVRVNHGLLPQLIGWSASGYLFSGGLGGLKQWEFASSDAVSSLRLDTDKAANGISPDSRWIVALHSGGDVAKSFQQGTPDSRNIQDASIEKPEFVVPVPGNFGVGFTLMIEQDQEWFGEVWNTETGKRHCQLHGPANFENCVFSPNGRYLVVPDLSSPTLHLFNLTHLNQQLADVSLGW